MSTLDPLNYADYIRSRIRTVPDWPQAGVQFRDITPLLQDPKTFRVLVDVFVHRYMDQRIDLIAGLDARGFILGSVVAYELNIGFVPVRKKGKLPYTTVAEEYELEYGNATVEVHTDACQPGQRVVVLDDLVATGGTMMAGVKLLSRLGGEIVEAGTVLGRAERSAQRRGRERRRRTWVRRTTQTGAVRAPVAACRVRGSGGA